MFTSKFDEPLFKSILAGVPYCRIGGDGARSPQPLRLRGRAPAAMLGIHARDFDEMDELKQAGRQGFCKSLESHRTSLLPGYLVRKARWSMLDWLNKELAISMLPP